MEAQAHQRQDRATDKVEDLPGLAQTYVSYQSYRDKPADQVPRQERLSALEIERVRGVTETSKVKNIDERAAELAARPESSRENVGRVIEKVEIEDNVSAPSSSYRLKSPLLFGLNALNFALQGILAISHLASGNGIWWLNVLAATCWGICAAFQVEKVKTS